MQPQNRENRKKSTAAVSRGGRFLYIVYEKQKKAIYILRIRGSSQTTSAAAAV